MLRGGEAGRGRPSAGSCTVERKLAARRGWRFVMVEPRLYADVVEHLTEAQPAAPQGRGALHPAVLRTCRRTATRSWRTATSWRAWSGAASDTSRRSWASWRPWAPSTAAREGRGVRYFVNPLLGTHLAGAVRDRAQAEAPPLRLRLVEPAE